MICTCLHLYKCWQIYLLYRAGKLWLSLIATCTYSPIVSYVHVSCTNLTCCTYIPCLLYLYLVFSTYTLSPVPILSPVHIYSPLLVSLTYCPIPSLLCLYNYLLFYCNRLQCCSSNSPITARHTRGAIIVALILKDNKLMPFAKNAACMATQQNAWKTQLDTAVSALTVFSKKQPVWFLAKAETKVHVRQKIKMVRRHVMLTKKKA